MDESHAVEQFWNQPDLVDAYSTDQEALPYETDLICRAVAGSQVSGTVGLVHVLGVGGGRELAAIRAAAPDAEICAWDISLPMVESCRQRVAALGLSGVSVDQADISDLSEAQQSADVVVALGAVLGYSTSLASRLHSFGSISSLLREGGMAAIVVQQRFGRPDWAGWLAVRSLMCRIGVVEGDAGDRLSSHGDSRVLFHHYTRCEIRDLCAGSGLQVRSLISLRQWGGGNGSRIPLGSPNPLILLAERTNSGH